MGKKILVFILLMGMLISCGEEKEVYRGQVVKIYNENHALLGRVTVIVLDNGVEICGVPTEYFKVGYFVFQNEHHYNFYPHRQQGVRE